MKKTISFILCLCLIFPLFTSVFSSAEIEPSRKVTWEDVFAGAASPEEMFDPIPEKDVPAAVGYADALKRGHIERLYKEETGLNTAVFRNADGTKTLYSFDYPIKYITETGSVRDISLSVSDSGTNGVSYQSDAKAPTFTQFSSVLSDGIRLRGNSAEIKLIPLPEQTENDRLNGPARIKKLDDKTVSYRYGVNTTLEYSLTYSGFKEDIVVSNYTGQTEYSFELQTGGLTPVEIDGEWYLTDSENEIKASIGNIIIFTADERNNGTGTITVEEQEPQETYLLTIHVDPDYLSDPKTVYPIRIDPTIEINASSAAGSIEDVTINQNTGSSGSSTSLYIGCRNTYGITRILMRFPNLDLSAIPSAENITSASVSLRDLMCQADEMDVLCYVFNGNSWTESTAEWSNVNPNSYTLFLSSNTISYNNGTAQTTAHWYPFDVTNAVKGWKIGSYTQGKGILFKASGTVEAAGPHSSKTFASFNRASYKPYLIINYTTGSSSGLADGTYYLNNRQYGQFLKYSGSVVSSQSGLLANLGSSIRWDLQRYGNNYVIHPVGNSSVFLAVPESTSANTVTTYTSTGSTLPSRCLWTLSAASGGGALLQNSYNQKYLTKPSESSVGTTATLGTAGTEAYYASVWRVPSITYYGTTSGATLRELTSDFTVDPITLDIGQSATPTIHKSPSNAGFATVSDFNLSVSSNAVISTNNSTHTITALSSGTVSVMVVHKVTLRCKYITVKVNKNAIIVIPGIMGSVLQAGPTNTNFAPGTILWDTALLNQYNNHQISLWEVAKRLKELRCNSSGYSINDVIPVTTGSGTGEIYQDILSSLQTTYGSTYDVCFFAYDWRLSNADSAISLYNYINANHFDSVVLVAHSMGGLVASAYLALGTEQQAKVRTLITVGSPLLGAPIVPYLWGSEDFSYFANAGDVDLDLRWQILGVLVSWKSNILDYVMGNFPSMYEMFPTEKYFDSNYGNSFYLGYSPDGMSRVPCTSYSATRTALENYWPFYSSSLADDAESFHSQLYINGEHITNSVNTFYLIGYNCKMEDDPTADATIEQIFYYQDFPLWFVTKTPNGDGTVPVISAALGDRYASKTYYIDGGNHIDIVQHIENKDVLPFIANLVANDTTIPASLQNIISATLP